MRFRFTPTVKRFSRFANIVIKDFIQKAKNYKQLDKKFNNLETGYDYAIAYISHFNSLKRRNVLFQNRYTVNFGDLKQDVFLSIEKQDESKSKGEFLPDGVILDNGDKIPMIRIFVEKMNCKKRGFIRRRFNYIENIRRYIVHETSHLYQFAKYEAFVDDEIYIGPSEDSKAYILESFLYMFQGEELDATMYEAFHTWNVNKFKVNLLDTFVTYIAEELNFLERKDYTSKEFFKAVKESEHVGNEIIVNYIFREYLPKSRFAKYFKKIPGLSLIKNRNYSKVISEMFSTYKKIAECEPIPKLYANGFRNDYAFSDLLFMLCCNL